MAGKSVAVNRKARHDFEFLDKFEAGIQLLGTEVKSLRDGKMSFGDAFCYVDDEQIYVKNLHISVYEQANRFNHDPLRVRKLLLHKREIRKIEKKLQDQGVTVVPVSVYFNEAGIAKMEIAVAKGKKMFDKREALKEKDAKKNLKKFL